MSTTNTTVWLQVPSTVNYSQFLDVQRGTIFLWFLSILFVMIITGVRFFSGHLDPEGAPYEDKKQSQGATEVKEQNTLASFDKQIIKDQTVNEEEDTGTIKLIKKVLKLETVLLPLSITFALSFVIGATYAFSLVLYFFVLIPLILFNVLQLHKRCIEHKVILAILDNLWVVLSFFWMINIWTLNRYIQPYYVISK